MFSTFKRANKGSEFGQPLSLRCKLVQASSYGSVLLCLQGKPSVTASQPKGHLVNSSCKFSGLFYGCKFLKTHFHNFYKIFRLEFLNFPSLSSCALYQMQKGIKSFTSLVPQPSVTTKVYLENFLN